MEQSTVTLIIRGRSCTHVKGAASLAQGRKTVRQKTKGIRLKNRRQRSIVGLIRALSSIKGTHQCFLSLIFPKRRIGDDDYKNKKMIYFHIFISKLKYKYKHCKFIYKVEWSRSAGIHFHMIGSLHKNKIEFDQKRDERGIRKLWAKTLKIVDKNKIKKAASLKPYSNAHISYLCTNGKLKLDMRCCDLIKKSKMYGFINKKNFKFYKKIIFKLTYAQFNKFKELITKYLEYKNRNIHSYIEQFNKTVGMFSFISHNVIINIYKKAVA